MIENLENPDRTLFYVICAAQIAVCVAAVGLIIVTVIFLLIVLKDKKKKTGKVFCGRCGEPLNEMPTSAVALPDKVFLAYECDACKNVTLLPKAP